jgi:hypothetical protein
MKRVFVIMLGVFVLFGCGAAARESGFYGHNTMYKSYSHLKFSVYGHKQVDLKEVELTKKQDWWGVTIWGSK